jgi:hypothetical protein
MGLVKIEIGTVNQLKEFRNLLTGEIFKYRNSLYLKIGPNNVFNWDKMCWHGFGDAECVVPVNSKLVVEE